ncbi:MAG TPA: type II toxin-antitoxin system VapC family toxin [Stellaceae bacterium]|nr:type II toxin-antitoxin system VapC family toxin [Stellaceae bacterium]
MIILDTNVISEVMLPSPAAQVLEWLRGIPIPELATTAINIAEIRYGLARLPFGRRRSEREALFGGYLAQIFEDRIYAFDALAADTYGELIAGRERSGLPLRGADGFIAAIAVSRGLRVATRDVSGFAGCAIDLINPWEAGSG